MKKFLLPAIYSTIAILVLSCGPSLKVSNDFDKSVDFKKYKTFALYRADTINPAISELNRGRVIEAIKSEMKKKGFEETTSNPDVLVNAVAIFQDKTSVTANTNYYGYGGVYRPYYWGGVGSSYSYTSYDVNHYKEGSLIIDVIDASTKQLIWQGIGQGEVDGPLKDPDTRIPKGIASIMAGFPPGTGKK